MPWSGEEPSLNYAPGNERIPENWYTRAVGDEYTIPLFVSDLGALAQEHPELLDFGGNTGSVNSFAGLDVTNLTVSHFSLVSFINSPSNTSRLYIDQDLL